jgi:hypothetical protein
MQFRLRTLFIATGFVAVILASYLWATRDIRARRTLIAAGARIEWVTVRELVSGYATRLPDHQRYYSVQFTSDWKGKSVQSLQALRKIRAVVVDDGARVSAGDLDVILGLPELETLVLFTPVLRDGHMDRISGLQTLRVLHVSSPNVTDHGLGVLRRLHQLEELGLSATAVGDQGLEELAGLRNLRRLALNDTTVTDGGMMHLPSTLEQLQVARTTISDVGLKAMSRLRHLRILDVRQTLISDRGLQWLHGHPSLNRILASDTDSTPAGISSLYGAWAARDRVVGPEKPLRQDFIESVGRDDDPFPVVESGQGFGNR